MLRFFGKDGNIPPLYIPPDVGKVIYTRSWKVGRYCLALLLALLCVRRIFNGESGISSRKPFFFLESWVEPVFLFRVPKQTYKASCENKSPHSLACSIFKLAFHSFLIRPTTLLLSLSLPTDELSSWQQPQRAGSCCRAKNNNAQSTSPPRRFVPTPYWCWRRPGLVRR